MSIRVERSEVHPSGAAAGGGPAVWHVRLAGLALIAGPLLWGATFFTKPEGMKENEIYALDMIMSVFYLAALFALSTVVLAARASGDRAGRAFPIAAMVLFPFGMATSLGSVPHATYEDTPLWVNVTDPAWPLTQVALFCASVAIIRARRWQGAARWLPLAGSLWLVPCMIAQMFLSEKGLGVVYNGWMLGTYVALGALFLARPETARPLPRTADA